LENQNKVIGVEEFLSLAEDITIADVRSPSEFAKGHIPGAVNIALFSDRERARVGTVYKQKGEEEAVLTGLDFVGSKMSDLLKKGKTVAANRGELLLYCWRGGRRSASMAWLFSQGSISCKVLEGGYKNYRSYVMNFLGREREIIVVGGMTGSGKTEILKEIAARGEQVIDLEGLARHRGSAFGAIGMPAQPTTEYFANTLFDEIRKLDDSRRLFIEDESLNIGSVFMPEAFYERIRDARVIAIMCSIETRMPRLLEEYGRMPKKELEDSLSRIRKRLGGKEADEAIESVRKGEMKRAVEIVLNYYDKTYAFGLGKRDPSKVVRIKSESNDAGENAELLIRAADKLNS
jgi:tRNA 2-selenouridine synthase